MHCLFKILSPPERAQTQQQMINIQKGPVVILWIQARA